MVGTVMFRYGARVCMCRCGCAFVCACMGCSRPRRTRSRAACPSWICSCCFQPQGSVVYTVDGLPCVRRRKRNAQAGTFSSLGDYISVWSGGLGFGKISGRRGDYRTQLLLGHGLACLLPRCNTPMPLNYSITRATTLRKLEDPRR